VEVKDLRAGIPKGKPWRSFAGRQEGRALGGLQPELRSAPHGCERRAASPGTPSHPQPAVNTAIDSLYS